MSKAIKKGNMYEVDQFNFAKVLKLTREDVDRYVHFVVQSKNPSIAYPDTEKVLTYAEFKLVYPTQLIAGILGFDRL